MKRVVLCFSAVLLIASGALIAPTPGSATGASALVVWDPTALPLLTTTSGTGTRVPVLKNDTVDGTVGLATSLQPILTWTSVPSGVGQATFKITTITSSSPTTVWEGTASVTGSKATATVPAGRLAQGHAYYWSAYKTSDPTVTTPTRLFTVDTQRANVQQLYDAGVVSVAEVTGEPISIFSSLAVSTKEGDSSFQLVYRPSNPSRTDLPAGWALEPGSGTSNWVRLQVLTDGSVELTSQSGEIVTFVKADAAGDAYKPEFGANQNWPNGSITTLVPETLPDQSVQWTATESNRMVTVFSATSNVQSTAQPTSVWSAGGESLQQVWSGGQLTALVDPVSNSDVYDFYYQGSPNCPSPATGGIAVPAGMLCAASDWAGQLYGLSYVSTPGGPEIGRIVGGLGTGELAQVTDYQWDASRRLVGIRTPLATSAVASGSVLGLGAQDQRALYQIAYDAEGRVSSITPPAGLVPNRLSNVAESTAQEQRVPTTFSYTPNFKYSQQAKVLGETSSSPTTMLMDWSKSGTGAKVTMTWDNATGNLLTEQDSAAGSSLKNVYDANGRPIEQLGPSTASLTSSNAPKTATVYDSDANGVAWKGLATTYYDNPRFEGAPVSGSVGPKINGNLPSSLNFNFSSAPVTPGVDGWAARMTGVYVAPSKGEYTFTKTGEATVWLRGHPCAPSCSVTLDAGATVDLRIDIVSTAVNPGIDLDVTVPGAGSSVAVPTASLRPNLGYPTKETVTDSLSATSPTSIGAAQQLSTYMTLDPTTGEVLGETSPAGTVVSNTYNADGSPASTTNAAGETIATSYYGGQDTADISCGALTGIPQRGLAQSVSRPGFDTATVVHSTTGAVSTTTYGASGATCASNAGNPFQSASATKGVGATTVAAGFSYLWNDPLQSLQVYGTSTHSEVEETTIDLLGNEVKLRDEFGTTTAYTYDPVTNLVSTITETTAKGEVRTESLTYNADGQVTQVREGTQVLETATYNPTSGLISGATLANGVKVSYVYGANNQVASLTYTFPDGSVASNSGTYSVGGRLLCDATTAPDGTATECYQADRDGKIVGASESGSLPVLATAWTAGFAGARGKNADRSELTTTLTEAGKQRFNTTAGTRSIAETFGSGDVLSSLDVGGSAQSLTTDAAQRVTTRGGTTLSYTANGAVTSVAHAGATESFSYGPDGVDGETYRPAPPAAASVHTTASTTSLTTAAVTSTSPSTGSVVPSTSTPAASPAVKPQAPLAASRSTTAAITVQYSGADLLLGSDGSIVGQTIDLASGVTVGLSAAQVPTSWNYPGIQGEVLWHGTNASVPATMSYDPWGTLNSVATLPTPTDGLSLVMDQSAWSDGQGGVTILADPSLVQLGSRTYDSVSGRFLQPDPQIDVANPYAYLNGDPVDGSDASGNWGSWGDIFSVIVGVVVGSVLAVAAPITGGSSVALGFALLGAVTATAAVDFGASVLGQVIDGEPISWAAAGVNAGISSLVSIATFGIARIAAAPSLLSVKYGVKALFRGGPAALKNYRTQLAQQGAAVTRLNWGFDDGAQKWWVTLGKRLKPINKTSQSGVGGRAVNAGRDGSFGVSDLQRILRPESARSSGANSIGDAFLRENSFRSFHASQEVIAQGGLGQSIRNSMSSNASQFLEQANVRQTGLYSNSLASRNSYLDALKAQFGY